VSKVIRQKATLPSSHGIECIRPLRVVGRHICPRRVC